MTGRKGRLVAASAVLLAAACGRLSDERALSLVRHYNQQNIEAFRTGDARITEPYTSVEEGKKLLGLIGVRLDMGRTLDSELLEFEPLGVTREGDAVLVRTRERWHWVERKIGTGEPVGLDSTDRYLMTYRLEKVDDRWVVASTAFTEAPEIGRPWSGWSSNPKDVHGQPAKSGAQGPAGGSGP
jgi:hypothetical protein